MFLSSLSNFFPARFNTKELHCSGGVKNGTVCENSDKCVGGPLYYTNSCSKKKSVRGLCVGGQNHGQFCGGNLDCPPKKHADSTEDTIEYGLCVGAALDEGKVIPKNDPTGHGFGRGLERLLELFPAWFNTWEWKGGHYTVYTQDKNKDNPDNYASFKNQGDYTFAKQTQFNQPGNCGVLYPTEGCNPKANVDPKPPTVTSIKVNDQSGDVSGSGGILNAVLRFHAYADHDQMPLVRLAVDWGDGSDPYVMSGWFKNRKKKCNVPHWLNQVENWSCSPIDNKPDGCRVRFGDSSDACEEGFYQFTHIYECPGKATAKVPACTNTLIANCWNASTKSCIFTPRVQVLDNWGWCNSQDGKGRWNDNEKDETKKNCRTDKNNNENPWTFFSSTVEVKPQ